jgi:hypothetical protein
MTRYDVKETGSVQMPWRLFNMFLSPPRMRQVAPRPKGRAKHRLVSDNPPP